MSKCSTSKENISTLVNIDRQEALVYKGIIDRLFTKNALKRSQELSDQLLKEGFPLHTFVEQKWISVAAIKAWGTQDEIKKYAALITSLIDGNPGIASLVHKMLLVRMPTKIRMGDKKKGYSKPKSGIQVNMERYPVSTLKYIYNKTMDLLNQVNTLGRARAKVGSHMTQFKSPGKVAWLDPSGAVEAIASGVRDYSSKISSRINYFMTSPEFIPKSIRKIMKDKKLEFPKRSMEKILDDVKSLSKLGDRRDDTKDMKKAYTRLFSQMMKGQAYVDNNQYIEVLNKTTKKMEKKLNPNYKKFYIHRNYNPRRDENGYIMKYESTGDVMWSFQDPVLLNNYTPINRKKGEWAMDMNPTQFKIFEKAILDARKVTDAVFEYIVPEMKQSTDNLMQSLRDHYDGKLTDFAIKQIFFYGNTSYNDFKTGETIDLLAPLNKTEREEVDLVKETFSMTVKDDLVIANHGALNPDEPEYRKRYWPTIYRTDNLRFMIDKLAKDWREVIAKTEERMEVGFDNPEDAKKAESFLEKASNRLEAAESILNNMDNYHMDAHHNFLMNFASDNKHFKRISNAYDIRNARTDDGVFYDYLKNMMGTIERNNLAGTLLESLARLKADRNRKKPRHKSEEAKAIIEYAVNLHRTTYNSVKTVGILGDMESFTRKLNIGRMAYPPNWIKKGWGKLRGREYTITVTPEMQSRYMRTFTSKLSGLFLQNWKSAVTNLGGSYKNIVRAGLERTSGALHMLYFDKRYRKGIEKVIQQSAITEFSDFFSKAMVNDIVGNQLEAQVSEAIMKETIGYHERIEGSIYKKKTSKSESKRIFLENVEGYLKKSSLWMKAQEIDIKSKGRSIERMNEIRSRNGLYAANKLVQWAINKEYEMKPMVAQPLYKQWANTGFGTVVGLFSKVMSNSPLTMSNTEKHIRSLSFVIGAENAWENGSIRNDIHWSNYTDEKDLAAVIAIGREYSYFINYGMSTQDVASYQYGPAQMMGKFKYWSQQNAEAELEEINAAILSLSGGRDVKKASVIGSLKPILKMMAKVHAPGLKNRVNRLSNPEVAAVRTMWLSQGLGTVMWNLFFFNPVSTKHFKVLRRIAWSTGAATQMRNVGTSDLLHFMTLPIVFALRGLMDGFFGGYDDEEDLDKSIEYHLRRVPFAGYMVTWSYSAIMAVLAGLLDEEDLFYKKAEQTASILYGRPQLGLFNFLQETVKKGSTAVLDVLYDGDYDGD